jgi:pantoate--beta-alanine ligase
VEVIREGADLSEAADRARADDLSIGFVPTMGSFHEGHVSLMRRARSECDVVAVSIFVNPLQFGPTEDLSSYPRALDRDFAMAEAEGVNVAFAPGEDEVYPGGRPQVTVDPGPLGERLEGVSRPGHFRGVLTVVAKLLHLVGPSHAYFGEKDYQQLVLIRRMAADLSFPVEVVACPTVREPDGLALSSRNLYLSPEERKAALCLSEALQTAAERVREGDPWGLRVASQIAERVHAEPLARLDYVAVVDEEAFEDVDKIVRPARALVAARIGKSRLIDNIRLETG